MAGWNVLISLGLAGLSAWRAAPRRGDRATMTEPAHPARPGPGAPRPRGWPRSCASTTRASWAPCTSTAASGRCSAPADGHDGRLDSIQEMGAGGRAPGRLRPAADRARVRPTLLAPALAGGRLRPGRGTALIGEKAVHACTEAVETVIERPLRRPDRRGGATRAGPGRRPGALPRGGDGPRRRGGGPRARARRPAYPVLVGRDPRRLPRGDQDRGEDLSLSRMPRGARAYAERP